MLRIFSRAARSSINGMPLRSAHTLSIARPPVNTSSKAQWQLFTAHRRATCFRNYTSSPDGAEKAPPEKSQEREEIPWLDYLESAANAPWLGSTPPDHTDRLARSFSLLFHILLYLGRPQGGTSENAAEATLQFIIAFESAPVAADSEIARARHAIALLTRTITNDIITIPQSSPLRSKHSQIFALADALAPLSDVHLQGIEQGKMPSTGDVVDVGGKWQDFWVKAQPIILSLGEELDKGGFGLPEELEREAKAEQQRKEGEKDEKK